MSRSGLPYGVILRKTPLHRMTSDERRQILKEREWDRQNPEIVAALTAFIGRYVSLVPKPGGSRYVTWAESLPQELRRIPRNSVKQGQRMPEPKYVPTHLPAGSVFFVFARAGDRLLAKDDASNVWLLRREWLSVVEIPKASGTFRVF